MMFKLLNNRQTIQPMIKIINFFLILTFINISIGHAQTSKFFQKGILDFEEKKLDEAKINFEKDIVRNTKNIDSYLYLSKIHKLKKNESEFEKNLKTVLLLDPKNEEALYLFIKKKIEDADYDVASTKIILFKKVCKKMCNKSKELDKLKNKSNS